MQVYFTVNVERNLGTQAGVHSIEGVRPIWGPVNTGLFYFNNFNNNNIEH